MNKCSVEGCNTGVYADGLCHKHYRDKGIPRQPSDIPGYNRNDRLCTVCGYIGKPYKYTKGSFGVELLLWIFFLIPGLIYSIWRLSSRYEACPKCDAPNMIPMDSPVAKKILKDMPQ